MSAMTRSPACVSAGGRTSGIFGAPSVTVIDASIASPSSSCVSADRPVGRSIATTGTPERVDVGDDRLEQPGQPAVETRCRRSRRRAGRTREISREVQLPLLRVGDLDDREAEAAEDLEIRCARRRGRRRRCRAGTPTTSTPRCSSVRATTKPSPPLLPRPQSTATWLVGRSSNAASIAATTWRPAFSISTSDGMPMSSIVRRSASRICSVLSTRIGGRAYPLVLDCGQFERQRADARPTSRDRQPSVTMAAMRGAVYVNGTITAGGRGGRSGLRSRLPVRRRRLRDAAHLQPRAVPLRPPHAAGCARRPSTFTSTCPFDDDDAARRGSTRRWRPRASMSEAYIRILLTRGVGELTYDSDATPDAIARHHRQAARRAAGPGVRRRHHDLARVDPAQPSRIGEPAHQVEQPAEQRAGDAGGASPRRRRRR